MSGNYSDFTKSQQLKPKRVTEYRKIWLRIKDNGYDVIPLKQGKDTPFKDWPTLPNGPEDIKNWNGHAAAVRCYGSELLIIDVDVLIAAARDRIVTMLCERWPTFMHRCLHRHSGAVKIAFIGRVKTTKCYLHTLVYQDPALPKGKENRNHVELFNGNTKKYVAVHGLHSPGREYGYEGRSILDVPVADLPPFPEEDLWPLIDACSVILADCGLVPVVPAHGITTDKPVVYDITDATRFDVQDGSDGVDYDTLTDLFRERGELRVSASFIDGGSNRSRCRVGDCRIARCVCVFDAKGHIWHCPASSDPEAILAGLVEPLRKLAEEVGAKLPPPLPNWRERFINSGKPKASLHNAMLAIEAIGLHCWEDEFHGHLCFMEETCDTARGLGGEMTDLALIGVRDRLSCEYGFDPKKEHVRDAAMTLARRNQRNPVLEMLARAQDDWDGAARLDRMAADLLACEDTAFASAAVRKFMIAAVARVRAPGIKFDTIPVFESREGYNKSTALWTLAGAENFTDTRVIGEAAREVQERTSRFWIVEIADLAGMKKAEVETVKAFCSRLDDAARGAYKHFLEVIPRHWVAAGTTNDDRYLQSQSGNRRFWPLKVLKPINIGRLAELRLQLWGEAAHYQSKGESLVLPEGLWKAAGEAQEERRVVHAWEVRLEAVLDGSAYVVNVDGELRVTTNDILASILKIPDWRLHRDHSTVLAEVMKNLGWTHKKVKDGGKPVMGYVKVPVVPDSSG
jgi:Virulence-associated protein E